jgi:hypothetical protein
MRMLRRSSMFQCVVLAAVTLVQTVDANEDFAEGWAEWGRIVQYLIALTFVTFGLNFLLTPHLGTYRLMRMYQKNASTAQGQVLSCEAKVILYEIAVIYTAKAHTHEDDPRMKFRDPNAYEEKRFLRRLESKHHLSRGTVIEILVLPDKARSGLTREVVDDSIANHSHFRTILILVPGTLLTLFIGWMAIDKAANMNYPTTGYIVLGGAYAVILGLAYLVSAGRFEQEKHRRYFSATAQKIKNPQYQGTKSEPLLVVPQGVDVV